MRCRRRLWDSAALPGPPSHAALSLRRRRRLWDSGRTRLAGRAGSGARMGRASVALTVGPLEPLRGEEVALRAGGGRRAGGAGESRLGGLDLDGGSRPAFGPARRRPAALVCVPLLAQRSVRRRVWYTRTPCGCWHSGRCGAGCGRRASRAVRRVMARAATLHAWHETRGRHGQQQVFASSRCP
jgi:hypothetical protein